VCRRLSRRAAGFDEGRCQEYLMGMCGCARLLFLQRLRAKPCNTLSLTKDSQSLKHVLFGGNAPAVRRLHAWARLQRLRAPTLLTAIHKEHSTKLKLNPAI